MNMNNLIRNSAATTAAAALLLASGAAASADSRTITGATDGLSISDIRCEEGSLTLIKRPPSAFDGVDYGDLPRGTIDGATFTLRRVKDIDLTQQAGWDAAKGMSVEEARKRLSDDEWKAVSGRDGRAVFTGLAMGVYLVSETPPADRPKEYRKTSEFLITVPAGMRSADGSVASWSCDVQVFTKDINDTPPSEPSTPPATTPPSTTPSTPPDTPPTVPSVPVFPPNETSGTPAPSATPTPSESGTPKEPRKQITERLGNTGANVLGVVALGLALTIGGFLVQRRRKGEDTA
ncbi:TPA: LPXTG cell wall anchor domain-containing protein [Corynebacterium striatum]|nr:LPXTG cell wall anchor domain-containing protein [Corynebacterium striatum]HCG2990553.1 LPXTG cell wall anchor domain-containing protein [Corynebacterium striatum]HCG3144471.1 LPXTG cell wall anchor domain-containing protein [Corynebacterium striatum]HCG3167748.1 LPXTG cell wall anchor domain-containing protein [Corynebacterium striatum]